MKVQKSSPKCQSGWISNPKCA